MSAAVARAFFPREFRGGLFKTLDKPFAGIFLVVFSIVSAGIYWLSHRPVSHEASTQQIARIQERYARLVLNQPEPKPPEQAAKTTRERKGPAEEKAEEKPTVDRAKESLAERTQRRERTQEDRAAKRQKLDQKIASVGIFAAITSSSDDPSDPVVQDLMAGGDVTGDLSNLAVSGQSFSRKAVDLEERKRERRENRAAAGSIAQSTLQKAAEEKVSRRGNVSISQTPQTVEGAAKQSSERTHEAIGAVIKGQQAQLVYVLEKWLKRDPNLSGKVLLRFTILPTGAVTGVAVVSSTTNNPEFDEAIARYVRRWTFAPIDGSHGSVTVVYPFVFTRANG